MLGLSTHEPHFYIIREAITNNFNKRQKDLERAQSMQKKISVQRGKRISAEFNLVSLFYVREFLDRFYSEVQREMEHDWDLENIIDDFVFLCFFGGNDFLPHLPALSIHQGGVDILMHLYKKLLPDLGGYLTNQGKPDLARVELFMREFAKSEESILKQIEQNQKELVGSQGD